MGKKEHLNQLEYLLSNCVCVWMLPELPVQRHGTYGPPALVQAAAGLQQRVPLCLSAARRVLVLQQDVAQTEDRRHPLRVLLDVPLQLLDGHGQKVRDDQNCMWRPPLPKF